MIKQLSTKRHIPLAIGWLVTSVVILFYMYEYFLRLAPSSMVDYFISEFGFTVQQVGSIDSAYYWTYIPMQIIVGTLMDHYGVRRPLLLALATCLIGSVFYSVDGQFWLICLGRALIGFGSAFGFVAVLKTANNWLPKKQFSLAVGISTALGMLGAIFSLDFFTRLIKYFPMNTIINMTIIFGMVLTLLTYWLVYDRQRVNRPTHAKKRMSVLYKTFYSVFFNPQIWLIGFVGFSMYLPTQMFSGLWAMPYFMHVRKFSPEVASNISGMLFWGWIIGSPLVGYIAEYVSNKRLMLMVGASGCVTLLSMIVYLPITSLYALMIAMFLLGIFSSTEILVFDIATNISKSSHAGTAVAITNMIVMLGGSLQSLIGYIIESHSVDGQVFTEHGFQVAFMIMPILCLLAIMVTLMMRETR